MAKLQSGTVVYGVFTANTSVFAGTLNVAPAIASAYDKANSANYYAYLVDANANAAFAKANSANYYAYLVDANATAAFTRANSVNAVAIANVNYVNTAMQAAFSAANNSNTVAIANVNYVNTAMQAAFAKANAALGISEAVAANVSNSTTYYLTFVNANTGSFANVNVSSRLTYNANAGSLTVGNTVFATHFDNISDITLKDNIKPLQNTIITLNNLNPVSFTWKKDGTKSFGLIAQEVEKVIPEIVHMTDNETKTVSYVQIISFLISAFKEQQAQIDDINRRLNA